MQPATSRSRRVASTLSRRRTIREEREIVSIVILIVGIGFVALLTGAFAQRFLGPEIAEVEEELEAEQISAEAVAMRELRAVRAQVEALEIAVERMVDQREPR